MRAVIFAVSMAIFSFFGQGVADQVFADERLSPDVAAAVSADSSVASAAIARLRRQGSRALDELLKLRDRLQDGDASLQDIDPAALDAAIDGVGGARYCTASRLFWHTDLDAAKAEARKTGKPILSLRMMGNLTDEYSCANSRFFRTTLYANRKISDYLRENYVLHWKSVRPVPKVTIDFGDGRKLTRTLTGNSVHYVLAADGRVIDGLPGLYGPTKFLAWITDMQTLAGMSWRLDGSSYAEGLKTWHAAKVRNIQRAWRADLERIKREDLVKAIAMQASNPPAASPGAAPPAVSPGAATAPTATNAALIARPKSLAELPLIANVTLESTRLNDETTDELWEKLAALHHADAELDEASVALIGSENPTAARAAELTVTKRRVESPLIRLIARFQSSIALDTVRNEYELHRQLHEWLAGEGAQLDVEALNERVYDELFLTPRSDPWIGLVPRDTYTGLVNDGVVVKQPQE